MKAAAPLVLVLIAAAPAAAANRASVSAEQLAAAVNHADGAAVPYRHGSLAAADVRSVRCVGPDEEPTEFQCNWLQRTQRGWIKRQTWLAVDGQGWRVID
jgi:hypothetical protein